MVSEDVGITSSGVIISEVTPNCDTMLPAPVIGEEVEKFTVLKVQQLVARLTTSVEVLKPALMFWLFAFNEKADVKERAVKRVKICFIS